MNSNYKRAIIKKNIVHTFILIYAAKEFNSVAFKVYFLINSKPISLQELLSTLSPHVQSFVGLTDFTFEPIRVSPIAFYT